MIGEAASESGVPGFAPSTLHPTIWTAAAAHWTTHQYRVAVREAAEALTVDWKMRFGRNDVDDTVFWQQTLSPGEPELGSRNRNRYGPASQPTRPPRACEAGLEPLAKGDQSAPQLVSTSPSAMS
jgi:hypothetical protein